MTFNGVKIKVTRDKALGITWRAGTPKAHAAKEKTDKQLHKKTKFCASKDPIHKVKKHPHRTGANICKSHIQQGINIQNIQNTAQNLT